MINPGFKAVITNIICANPCPEKLSLNAELTFSVNDPDVLLLPSFLWFDSDL